MHTSIGKPFTVSFQEVLFYYEFFRKEFPGAQLTASTYDDFFEAVTPITDQLPVVNREIGDTWIYGIASDPRKLAEYRAVSRVMKQCVASGRYIDSVQTM